MGRRRSSTNFGTTSAGRPGRRSTAGGRLWCRWRCRCRPSGTPRRSGRRAAVGGLGRRWTPAHTRFCRPRPGTLSKLVPAALFCELEYVAGSGGVLTCGNALGRESGVGSPADGFRRHRYPPARLRSSVGAGDRAPRAHFPRRSRHQSTRRCRHLVWWTRTADWVSSDLEEVAESFLSIGSDLTAKGAGTTQHSSKEGTADD